MATVIYKSTCESLTSKVKVLVDDVPKFLALMKEKGLKFERSKVVKATYIIEQTFEIPAGVDLEADDVTWGVKWNTLEIFKDDKIIAEDIAPQRDAFEDDSIDWKRPNKVEIADYEDMGDAKEDDGEALKDSVAPNAGAGASR